MAAKAAIVLLAGAENPEGLGRVVNALTTAKEFKQEGDEVTVILDGAGTTVVRDLTKPDHKYSRLFAEVRDVIGGACAYCSKAYGVGTEVEREQITLLDDFDEHPSIRTFAVEGYLILTF